MTENSSENELERFIIQTVRENKLEAISELVALMKQKYQIPDKQILNHILSLQEKEKIHLEPPQTQRPETLGAYMSSGQAAWYWITVILTAATVLVVFTAPEDAYPLAYLRNILGTLFVLWLPGYAFIKALFPRQLPIKTTEKDLDTIERIALSMGMSLALVPLTGLLLNYTPWGIRLTPITLSLTALTPAFATAAVIREHQTTKTKPS